MIYPMFSMILLTIIIGFIAIKERFKSVQNGSLNIEYFKLMQGQKVPASVIKTTRCFNNQFELPTLFYAGCLLAINTNKVSFISLLVAWLFVITRTGQAYIHITHNTVRHRMFAFALSAVLLISLWCYLVLCTIGS